MGVNSQELFRCALGTDTPAASSVLLTEPWVTAELLKAFQWFESLWLTVTGGVIRVKLALNSSR